MPRDKVTGDHLGYGFVELKTEEDASYSIKILHMIKLFNRPLKLDKASNKRKVYDVGANIFIKNLNTEINEN